MGIGECRDFVLGKVTILAFVRSTGAGYEELFD
jgi:hypothetical protein